MQLAIAVVLAALLAIQFAGLLEQYAGASDHDPGNLVVNGSFEEPVVPGSQNLAWYKSDQVPGWTVSDGWVDSEGNESEIEILRNWTGIAAAHGEQFVELAANEPIAIHQDFDGTVAGTVYRLDYAFAARPNHQINQQSTTEKNRMRVNWGAASDDELGTIRTVENDPKSAALDPDDWTAYTDYVVAVSDTSRIEFAYAGPAGSTIGALLDDISLVPAVCTSKGAGNWNDAETWDCGDGFPRAGNDVVIQAGHTVTLTGNQAVNNLTIESGGTEPDGILDNTGGYKLTVYGDVVLDGDYIKGAGPNEDQDTVEFKGDKEQKVKGEKEPEFGNVKVDKEKKTGSEEKSTVEFEKKLKVKQKTEIENGKLKVGDAEFEGDVHIKKDDQQEKEGTLEGTSGKTKTYKGNLIIDGTYEHKDSTDSFEGETEQEVKGEKEPEFGNVKVDKKDKSGSEEKSTVEFEKKLKVKQKTDIEEGKLKVGDAEFEGDVEIKEDGELEGKTKTGETPSKHTFKGHKTVDGEYKHGGSHTEFTGDKEEQKVTSSTDTLKEKEVVYKKLIVEKERKEEQTQFEKKVKVEEQTDVENGKLKVNDASFEGDVHVKKDTVQEKEGTLEGTEGGTKTYKGDKKVDGKYIHKKSKDRFIGDKQQQKLHGSKDTKYYELELEKSNQDDLLDALAKLQIEHQLRLIKGTLKTNTVFGDVVIEENGSLVLGEDEDPTEVTGDWTNDGEFDAGAGTVIFNGSESQSIGGSSDTTFNNLEVQNNTTLNQTIVVNGTLKVTGELTLGEGGAIEHGENFQLEVGSGANLNMGCVPGEKKLTGGGWINSPAGAYGADPGHTGKGDFNFPVHCDAEGTKPTGNVSFELNSAALEFESTSIDTMLVLGNEATLTGYGTVNGTGDYGFAAVAVEGAPGNSGDPNQLSIVIWDRNADSTAYDSGGPIDTGGGNIKIHSASSESPGGGGSPGNGPGGNGPPGRR